MHWGNIQIAFYRPEFLVLLLLIPCLWWWSYRSLAGLGKLRRFLVLVLQSAVVGLLVCALAEIQWQRKNDRVTVIYLLDQSESIPLTQRQAMLKFVSQEVEKHRDPVRRDRAGIIVFGRDSAIEIPPFDAAIPDIGKLESVFEVRTDATNLAAALKMAQAMFAEDTAKRVMIVSDGNENMGDAKTVANALANQGIGIDVVPIQLTKGNEVAVERVVVPSDARQGQPTEVRVVLNNFGQVTAENPTGIAQGKLRISRTHDGEEELLSNEAVELQPGKNVFKLNREIEKTGSYFYRAEFVPESGAGDALKQNNIATGFTQVRGKGRVLFIENSEKKGEFDKFIDTLQKLNLEVKKVNSSNAFNSLAELQGFDTVVMANVPRASTDANGDSAVGFTDDQILMLVHNVEQLGCGLVMLGGENAFGCGGWSGTEIEKIMPVDFQIKNAAVKPNGALVLLMHASELAQGNYWQKVVGHKAVKMLGPNDYCGVLHWDDFTGGDNWLWKNGLAAVGTNHNKMLAQIDRMVPGDMPQFDPAMTKALTAFQGVQGKAAVRHMIVISDGDPAPPSPNLIGQYKKAGITISTVAIGTHGPPGSTPLQSLAQATGGKYYVVNNASALPSIYINEVKKIAKPLIYESPGKPFVPKITYPHEMLQGIDGELPPLSGFVLTTKKEHPLVEVSILSPVPDGGGENGSILASWTYKAGRTVAFTTDVGQRWASDWQQWANYEKMMSQMVRWSMRPVNEQGKFTMATDLKDGRVRVVVTATDNNDEFLNFLSMSGTATSPDPKQPAVNIAMRQEAPGRYVGDFTADEAGSYFLAINPGKGYGGPLLAGVTVPYSAEFRERETNLALLEMLAKFKPQGGEGGQLHAIDIAAVQPEQWQQLNSFRATLAKAFSSQDAWPLALLIASGCFLLSVAIRRISIDPEWFAPLFALARSLLRREQPAVQVDQRIDRLRSKKAELTGQLEERRAAATRFEAPTLNSGGSPSLDEAMRESPTESRPTGAPASGANAPSTTEEESYTDRLLKAKRRAQQNRGPDS
jgi:uncharacterized membrane protein/Mg-chelatase subunit ChlD